MPVTRERIYILLHRLTDYEIGHRPIPEQAGLDGFKGVQVKQLHRIGPLLPGEPSRLLQLLRDDLVLALEAAGDAQERRGEAEEAVRVLLAAEGLCGVAV